MSKKVKFEFPTKEVNGEVWAQLSHLADTQHIFVGERHDVKDPNYSFAGGHRVRKISLRKNVHWLITQQIMNLDISQVPLPTIPRKK